MLHGGTVWPPLLECEKETVRREHIFVAIDDFFRKLLVTSLPDKPQISTKAFLNQVLMESPFSIEQYCTDNGK